MGAVWNVVKRVQSNASLQGRCDADVAIVGGGITGTTLALLLAQAGQRVALLEAERIGCGATGHSTGNLYATVSLKLGTIRRKWGDEVTREVANARRTAVDFVQQTVDRFAIDCQFQRCPVHFALTGSDTALEQSLDYELETSRLAGLDAAKVDAIPGLSGLRRALRIEQQAQFNPLAFTLGVAQAAQQAGAQLFENSPVRDIDAGRGVLVTDGGEVHAGQIVHATHTPKGINLLQTAMEPYLEYGVAAVAAPGMLGPGIHWLLDASCSLRTYEASGQHWIVAVGGKHKTGEAPANGQTHQRLRELLTRHFNVSDFPYAWSAQQFHPADELPYIGGAGHANVYVATGFAADGLTWGPLAANIIADQLQGVASDWADRFAARRFTPAKSAGNWMKENIAVARHMVGDRLGIEKVATLEQVSAGAGRIVEYQGENVAVYNGAAGIQAVSPVCPHLKCLVQWNAADTTWDCTCHGSRFRPDGSVIEGPALLPLAPFGPS